MAAKKDGYATKDDVREIVTDISTQASDAILNGIERMLQNYPTKDEFDGRFKKVDNELAEIKLDIHYIKDNVKNIEAYNSTMPTRSEFNKLKSQIDLTQ